VASRFNLCNPRSAGLWDFAFIFEERRNLLGSTVWVFSVREMAHSRKARQVEVGERLPEAIRPRIGEYRIMFGPPDTGWDRYWRQHGHLSLHHGNPPRVSCTVIGKATRQIAPFEEVIHEDVHDIVEGILPVAPMPNDVTDVEFTRLPGAAQQGWGHLHLME
jgi:hypothetical protein